MFRTTNERNDGVVNKFFLGGKKKSKNMVKKKEKKEIHEPHSSDISARYDSGIAPANTSLYILYIMV